MCVRFSQVSAGVVYGDYYLLGKLAQGGMAEVFLAKSLLGGDRLLAVKRTLEQFVGDDDFTSMFRDEARIARGLDHANICTVVDEGTEGEQLYIVMEFIHGKDLKLLAQRALSRGEAIPFHVVAFILARIAEALHAAHSKTDAHGLAQNIVHRDVSPQNILISYDGVPKLIDFGVAKARDRLAKTQVGVVKGKFAYMSPEQAVGAQIDSRSDIFGLGVVLYALLTGKLPFLGDSDFATLRSVSRAEYAPPRREGEEIPAGLLGVLEKALTRSPDTRYQTADAMARDIDLFLAHGNKEPSYETVSAYVRRLFREEYQREMARIRMFMQVEPPGWARERALKRLERRQTSEHPTLSIEAEPVGYGFDSANDRTTVQPMADLAAGYTGEYSKEEFTASTDSFAMPKSSDPAPIEVLELDDIDLVDASEFDSSTKELSRPRAVTGHSDPRPHTEGTEVVSTQSLADEIGHDWNDGGPTMRQTIPTPDREKPSKPSDHAVMGFDPDLPANAQAGTEAWGGYGDQFDLVSVVEEAPEIADILEPDHGYEEGASYHPPPHPFLTNSELLILFVFALLGAGVIGVTYFSTLNAKDTPTHVEAMRAP